MAYRGKDQMIEGAKRVLSAEGTIVSFNGNACDLPRLFELLQLEQTESALNATHDMWEITSNIRVGRQSKCDWRHSCATGRLS
jgi:hypothetical protein